MSDNLLTIEAVMAAIGLKRTKIYAMIASGDFPQPIKIGAASRWSEAEVSAWIAERKNQRPATAWQSAVRAHCQMDESSAKA